MQMHHSSTVESMLGDAIPTNGRIDVSALTRVVARASGNRALFKEHEATATLDVNGNLNFNKRAIADYIGCTKRIDVYMDQQNNRLIFMLDDAGQFYLSNGGKSYTGDMARSRSISFAMTTTNTPWLVAYKTTRMPLHVVDRVQAYINLDEGKRYKSFKRTKSRKNK